MVILMAKLRMAHASTHGARMAHASRWAKKKKERERERPNDGDNNGQATYGARKHALKPPGPIAKVQYRNT